MAANRSSLRFGKSQSSMGRRIADVLDAENSAVDANEMKSIQKTSGPYRQNRRRLEWGSIIRLKAQREAARAASLYPSVSLNAQTIALPRRKQLQ